MARTTVLSPMTPETLHTTPYGRVASTDDTPADKRIVDSHLVDANGKIIGRTFVDAPPERNANYKMDNMFQERFRRKVSSDFQLEQDELTARNREHRNPFPNAERPCQSTTVDLTSANRTRLMRAHMEEMFLRDIPEQNSKTIKDATLFPVVDTRSVAERYNGGRFDVVSSSAIARDEMAKEAAHRTAQHGRIFGPERGVKQGAILSKSKTPFEERNLRRPVTSGPEYEHPSYREGHWEHTSNRRSLPAADRSIGQERLLEGGQVLRGFNDA